MARWESNASGRLVDAALELFAERGYEETTVVDIATRAGLTKSTFFRHFSDKREVLFGGDALATLLADAIADAPSAAAPLDAVAHALDALATQAFPPERRDFARRRRAVVAAHRELQEREALKGIALVAASTAALERRGTPRVTAQLCAQVGWLAFTIAFQRWTDVKGGRPFGELARGALYELRETATTW